VLTAVSNDDFPLAGIPVEMNAYRPRDIVVHADFHVAEHFNLFAVI
jgi:hypothetical protein